MKTRAATQQELQELSAYLTQHEGMSKEQVDAYLKDQPAVVIEEYVHEQYRGKILNAFFPDTDFPTQIFYWPHGTIRRLGRYDPERKSGEAAMKKRTIEVTVYLVLTLSEKNTHSVLKETYASCSFDVTLPYADPTEDPANLVSDRIIHQRLDDLLEKQVMLPQLKKQYPTLPDFYISNARLFTQKAHFKDVA